MARRGLHWIDGTAGGCTSYVPLLVCSGGRWEEEADSATHTPPQLCCFARGQEGRPEPHTHRPALAPSYTDLRYPTSVARGVAWGASQGPLYLFLADEVGAPSTERMEVSSATPPRPSCGKVPLVRVTLPGPGRYLSYPKTPSHTIVLSLFPQDSVLSPPPRRPKPGTPYLPTVPQVPFLPIHLSPHGPTTFLQPAATTHSPSSLYTTFPQLHTHPIFFSPNTRPILLHRGLENLTLPVDPSPRIPAAWLCSSVCQFSLRRARLALAHPPAPLVFAALALRQLPRKRRFAVARASQATHHRATPNLRCPSRSCLSFRSRDDARQAFCVD